jgi:alkylresorcinol/alkylpyrone synthase
LRISATSAVYPPHYYTQRQVVEALLEFWGGNPEKAQVLERLHARTGAEGRYFSCRLEEYRALDTWGKANDI